MVYDISYIGGGYDSGYTCRTFLYKGKRYVIYIDKSEYGWALSLPKEVRVIDEKLRPFYTEILENLREETLIDSPKSVSFEQVSITNFWNIQIGQIKDVADSLLFSTKPKQSAFYVLKDVRAGSVEAEFTISLKAKEGGFLLRTFDDAGKEITLYHILLDAVNGNVSLYKGCNFSLSGRRTYSFAPDKKKHCRIIAMEGQLEVYIDDELLMQCAIETGSVMETGITCIGGEVLIEAYKIYKLKK